MNKQINQREICVDWMECIGILMVIIYHSGTLSDDFMSDPSGLNYFRYFFRALLSACVPIFFFANGYLLLNKPFNLKKHIGKTIRLMILAGVWGCVTVLLLMPVKGEYLSVKEVLLAVWTMQYGWIHHLWFLGALVCIYTLFPLLKIAYDRSDSIFIYFTVAIAILTFGNTLLSIGTAFVFSVLLKKGGVYQNIDFFSVFNLFRGNPGYSFVYFCLGGLAFRYKEKVLAAAAKKRNFAAAILLVIGCVLLWLTGIMYSRANSEFWDAAWNGYDTVFTLASVLSIYILCLNFKNRHSLIEVISSNTLGIYFVHWIIAQCLLPYVSDCGILHSVPGSVLYSLMILFISLGITLVIRKIPVVKKLAVL